MFVLFQEGKPEVLAGGCLIDLCIHALASVPIYSCGNFPWLLQRKSVLLALEPTEHWTEPPTQHHCPDFANSAYSEPLSWIFLSTLSLAFLPPPLLPTPTPYTLNLIPNSHGSCTSQKNLATFLVPTLSHSHVFLSFQHLLIWICSWFIPPHLYDHCTSPIYYHFFVFKCNLNF